MGGIEHWKKKVLKRFCGRKREEHSQHRAGVRGLTACGVASRRPARTCQPLLNSQLRSAWHGRASVKRPQDTYISTRTYISMYNFSNQDKKEGRGGERERELTRECVPICDMQGKSRQQSLRQRGFPTCIHRTCFF